MALDLGELRVALELDNDRLRAGLNEAKRELETLPPSAQREMTKVSRVMDEEGRKSGGVLAEGIRGGLVRASPLIVAGVSAAMVVGAPAVLAAATTLFAGVGIAAGVQNDEVRAAWAGLGNLVQDEAGEIAGPIADTLMRAADKTGAAFQRMKPQIIDGVSAAAPQVDRLVDATLGLVENALPGLTRAAENAGPAVDGLGTFLEKTGTAVGDFFEDVSDYAPEAGQAMSQFGDFVGELLPVLSQLLGSGSQVATTLLPMLTSGVGALSSVVDLVAPALPTLAQGFVGWQVGEKAAGWLGTAANAVGAVGDAMGGGEEDAGAFSSALSFVGENAETISEKAGPVLGAVVGALTIIMSNAQEKANAWATALREGGKAADEARAEMQDMSSAFELNTFGDWMTALGGTSMQIGSYAMAVDEAKEANQEYWDSLSGVQFAKQKLAQWTETLSYRLSDESATAEEVAIAQRKVAEYTKMSEDAQAELELALHGVTQAMVDQASQAMASIDSGFAYQHSLNQLEDAQTALADAQAHLNDTNENTRTTVEDVERAQLALSNQAYQTAQAFGQQQADLSGLEQGTAEYTRYVQENTLAELYRLRDAAGPEMAAALDQQIGRMQAAGIQLDSTGVQARAAAEHMNDLGHEVREVPGFKGVEIDAPTEDQRRRIEALGYKIVTLPDGSVYVTLDDRDALRRLNALTTSRVVSVFASWNFGAASGGPIVGRAAGGAIHHYDIGGAVHGPGTGTSDSVVALGPSGAPNYRLSDGEHIVTAAEVRGAGGHGAVMAQRQAWLGNSRRFADGGATTGVASSAAPAGTAAGFGRSGPILEISGPVTIADQGDAIRLAEELNYLARVRG